MGELPVEEGVAVDEDAAEVPCRADEQGASPEHDAEKHTSVLSAGLDLAQNRGTDRPQASEGAEPPVQIEITARRRAVSANVGVKPAEHTPVGTGDFE